MSVVESDDVAGSDSLSGPNLAPYPPYVQGDEERRRWDACYAIAANVSALYEATNKPDHRWTWYATRALYVSDYPTGESGDGELAEAYMDDETGMVDRRERAAELVAAAETALATAKEEGSSDALELSVQFSVEALETLFGDPDTFEVPDYPVDEQLAEAVALGKYREALHPRDRMGEWRSILGKIGKGAVAHERGGNKPVLVKHDPGRPIGVPLHNQTLMKSGQERLRSDAERIAKVSKKPAAALERQIRASRQSRVVRAASKAHRAAVGAGLGVGMMQATIHSALTGPGYRDDFADKVAEKGGRRNQAVAGAVKATHTILPDPRHEAIHGTMPPGAAFAEGYLNTMDFTQRSLDATRWASDHADELAVAYRLIALVAKSTVLAKTGLVAADDSDSED